MRLKAEYRERTQAETRMETPHHLINIRAPSLRGCKIVPLRKTAPWYDQIKAPIRAVNIGGLFVLERWILPTFTEWGDDSGIHDQHSFSEKCKDLGTCDDLKVGVTTVGGKEEKTVGPLTASEPLREVGAVLLCWGRVFKDLKSGDLNRHQSGEAKMDERETKASGNVPRSRTISTKVELLR